MDYTKQTVGDPLMPLFTSLIHLKCEQTSTETEG